MIKIVTLVTFSIILNRCGGGGINYSKGKKFASGGKTVHVLSKDFLAEKGQFFVILF